MKKINKIYILLLICLFCRFGSISAQVAGNNNDSAIINARTAFYKASKSFNQKKLMEAEALFERIAANANSPDRWIALYYIALVDETIAYTFYSDKTKQEQYFDKGIENLEKCLAINPQFDEAFILSASLYSAKIAANQSQAMTLSDKASELLKNAEKLDADNPRLYLVTGRISFYTPETFGGGTEKAKKELLKATELFVTCKIPHETYPDWGHDEAYSYLGQIAFREGDFKQAEMFYLKALEIKPDNGYVKYKLLPALKNAMKRD